MGATIHLERGAREGARRIEGDEDQVDTRKMKRKRKETGREKKDGIEDATPHSSF